MSGRFVWYDLATADADKARAFYTGLFGWTVREMEGEFGTYSMWYLGEKGLGGIMSTPEGQQIPPHWLSYLHAPGTIEEMVSKAEGLGANVMQPIFPIPTVGKMAIVADPQGAIFAPFETLPMETGNADDMLIAPGTKGGVSWNELMTSDPAAATTFYTTIAGFSPSPMDGLFGPYTILNGDKGPAAGLMNLPEGVTHPNWMVYFEVVQDSVDAALEKVKELGGEVGMGPMDVPGIATVAAVADSTGAWFGLMKSLPQPA